MFWMLYWNEFYTLKYDEHYLGVLFSRTDTIDRWIKAVLAIASTGSIGAWAVFREYAFLWGFIIAASQVLNALRGVLPYKERMKALPGLIKDIAELANDAEDTWLSIQSGKVTDAAIQPRLADLKRKKQRALNKHFANMPIPTHERVRVEAENATDEYVKKFYYGGS